MSTNVRKRRQPTAVSGAPRLVFKPNERTSIVYTHENPIVESAAIEAMSQARLLETSNAFLAAAYLGRRAKTPQEAVAALTAMAQILERSGSFGSRCAVDLRKAISTATEQSAVESCRDIAEDLAERGAEIIRVAIDRGPEDRKWWNVWN
jgi:hypothetical protein